MNIRITADSTCDLSKELIDRYQITITPLYVVAGDKSYRDGLDIDAARLYDMVDNQGIKVQTAAVNVADYLQVFGELRKDCDAVIHFTISSEMSSCYQNACLAAQEIGGVCVIDSRNLSTGIGHLAIDAAEMAAEGKSPEEICAILEEKKNKLDVSFVLGTLTYLARGGRCSQVTALGANLLKLRPCILVRNGTMSVGQKFRGKMLKCYKDYIRAMLADVSSIDPHRIFITDSGLPDDVRQDLKDYVRSLIPFEEIFLTQAGCTISGHCGPGCMGVLFYRK